MLRAAGADASDTVIARIAGRAVVTAMNEVLQGEIARLVDSGYELTAVTPDGRAELQREGELVRLRLQSGYVTAHHGLRMAPPVDPPEPPPPGGVVRRSVPGRVAVFGELKEHELRASARRKRRRIGIGKIVTVLVLIGMVVAAFVFSRAAVEGPPSAGPPPQASALAGDLPDDASRA
jgi:hypothetical protein